MRVSRIVGLTGAMLIVVRAAGETARDALPLIPAEVAETVLEPSDFALATPLLLMLTMWSEALTHETEFVISRELPSV